MKTGIREGSGGESVRRLQRILLSAGHEIGHSELEDGFFGVTTRTALRKLQIIHKLRVTGEVDNETLELLISLEKRSTKAAGFCFKHHLVWVKQHMVLGRSDYHYRHEPILCVVLL